MFCQHTFIARNRSPKVLFDLIQRTKDAVHELDNQIGSRFKKLLVESPANHHAAYQPVAAASATADDEDDDDDSSVSVAHEMPPTELVRYSMSAYTGVTNFQRTVQVFLAHPVESYSVLCIQHFKIQPAF